MSDIKLYRLGEEEYASSNPNDFNNAYTKGIHLSYYLKHYLLSISLLLL